LANYNNVVSRTDAAALIPEEVSNEMLGKATETVRGPAALPPRPRRPRAGPVPGPVGAARRVLGQRRHRSQADHRGQLGEQVPQHRGDRHDHAGPGQRGRRRGRQHLGRGHAAPHGGVRPDPRPGGVLRDQRPELVPDEHPHRCHQCREQRHGRFRACAGGYFGDVDKPSTPRSRPTASTSTAGSAPSPRSPAPHRPRLAGPQARRRPHRRCDPDPRRLPHHLPDARPLAHRDGLAAPLRRRLGPVRRSASARTSRLKVLTEAVIQDNTGQSSTISQCRT
jgi:hypothetical protein